MHLVAANRIDIQAINSFPEGASMPGQYGHLPLHSAVENMVGLNVVAALLQACKHATEVDDTKGDLSIWHLQTELRCKQSKFRWRPFQTQVERGKTSGQNEYLPLHSAVKNKTGMDMVAVMLQAYKHAAEVPGNCGSLSLHCATQELYK